MSLEGKVALITGASRGIGAAVARLLHDARGAPRPRLAERRRPRARRRRRAAVRRARPGAVTRALRRDGRAVRRHRHPGRERRRRRVRAVPRPLPGAPRRDDRRQPEGDALRGAGGAAAPARERRGRLITLASEAGRRGLPLEAVYCASKFGQVGFTRALDHELREHGVRCTNVCPGGVATDFALDEGRGRTPDVLPGDDDRRRTSPRSSLFVARRGRATTASSRRPSADDRGVMGMSEPVRWGIVSTAHINRLRDPAGARVAEGRAPRGREPRPARGPRRTRGVGDPARLRLATRRCSPTPTIEAVYISLPEHAALRVVDPRARGGQARPLREAASAGTRPTSRRRSTRRTASGRLLTEAFMYRHNPQTTRSSSSSSRDGAIGELRVDAHRVQLLPLRRRQHPPAHRRRGRQR